MNFVFYLKLYLSILDTIRALKSTIIKNTGMVALRLKIRFSVSFTSCQKKTASVWKAVFHIF